MERIKVYKSSINRTLFFVFGLFLLSMTFLLCTSTTVFSESQTLSIKSIKVEDKSMAQRTTGYEATELNEQTGEMETYWKYNIESYPWTITLTNGKTFSGTTEEAIGFTYNGEFYPVEFSSDQSAANPWGVGTHKAYISCGSYKKAFNVVIVEHPNLLNESYDKYYISGDYAYIIRKRAANLIAYFGKETEVKVPSELDGFKVTKILRHTFDENPYVERLILPEGLTVLASESITHCQNLKYIYYPSTLSYLSSAITYNHSLEEIEVSPKHKVIQSIDGTLYDKALKTLIFHPPASNVETLVIPDGVETILGDSCRDNPNLKSVVMPDSVTEVGDWAFEGDSNLEEINISENCRYFGQYALSGTKVRELFIPALLDELLENFWAMHYLEAIHVDEDNQNYFSIDGVLYSEGFSDDKEYVLRAYPSAKKDKEYAVLKGTTGVSQFAFNNAKYLEKVVLPENLNNLSYNMFYNCTNLETVIFFGKIKSIDERIFSGAENLEIIYFLGNYSKVMDDVIKSIQFPHECTFYYVKGKAGYADYISQSNYQSSEWKTITAKKRSSMKSSYYPENCKTAGKSHLYRYRPLQRATTDKDGKLVKVCSICGKESSSKKIPKIKTVKLSWTKKTYTGQNIKAPKVIVKDRNGNTLVEGVDYDLYDLDDKLPVGKYRATVQFKNRYKGYKYVYFTIVPKKPNTVKAELCGYDDVKVSWSKSVGATGYTVYYKTAKEKKYTYLTRTTKRYTYAAKNLSAGKKYEFKVVPYFQSGKKRYTALSSTTDSVYTLKKVSTPKVSKSGTKVKVKWKNISGETGYQISRSMKKNGTNIVATVKSAKATSKTIKAKKGKTYYYKVRAYKTVTLNGKTKKIYGPWSETRVYKR